MLVLVSKNKANLAIFSDFSSENEQYIWKYEIKKFKNME